MKRRIPVFCFWASAVLALTAGLNLSAKDLDWQAIPGGRWAALDVPEQGKTGFVLLGPDQTGVVFTNNLTEWQAAANRTLVNGSGVAAGDVDQDGWPDLFFCSLNGQNTLYKNLGNWRFKDVTDAAGLKRDGRFYRGAVFADINGDGALDLLISVLGSGVECYLNDGRGKFSDATAATGTGSKHGSMTLALADVDGDGALDLYVANNRAEDIRDRGQANLNMVNGRLAVPPALRNRLILLDGQVQEFGEPDQLFMNDGHGHFAPLSWTGGRFRTEAGGPLPGPPLDWGLTATFRDINQDGFPDIYVCNDFWTPDRVWLNDGRGRFRALPRLAMREMCASSMSVDFADIDRDGALDFFVVDMLSRDLQWRKRQSLAQTLMPTPIGMMQDRPQFMRNTLFRNRGDDTFAEMANYAGVAASEWSWSALFMDVDLDGYEDLLIATGHAWDVQDIDAEMQIRARQHRWNGFPSEQARQKAFTQELMEHLRLYPRLDTPLVAFHNRGGLRFEDVTQSWGTDQPGVHHAVALADLDRDGDLDLAVNNLGSAAGLYRNDTSAPRVAVRLKGLAGNVQGIGARIWLRDGAVPEQSQEVISGGRYLSGSDPLTVFAAGQAAREMVLEVSWRSGRQSRLTGVKANRIYEIDEAAASPANAATPRPRPGVATTAAPADRWFEDATPALGHVHHDEPFDDFQRQPMLPRRLSQLGPGVSWFDLDGDGDEDLTIGTGRGGQTACFQNDGHGTFQPLNNPGLSAVLPRDQTAIVGWRTTNGQPRLLAGVASYEDGRTNGPGIAELNPAHGTWTGGLSGGESSTGPLALADIDGDGDLDLFVGGRVIPGRYPEPASSGLYRRDQGQWHADVDNTRLLEKVGLVSGAVWSDLDGDGFPELVLACEWGPIKIFRNDHGRLAPWDPSVESLREDSSVGRTVPGEPQAVLRTGERLGGDASPCRGLLSQWTGWWNGAAAGDFDGDGRMDLVASNWGSNSCYTASFQHPLPLYYGDLLGRGVVNLIETEWDPKAKSYAPRRHMNDLARDLPILLGRFPSHRAYSDASISEVLAGLPGKAAKVEATTLASTMFLNRGDHFQSVPLPWEAQLAPAFALVVADFNGDGAEDLFLSQNFFALPPNTPRLDAGRGLLLRGDGKGGLKAVPGQESGIAVYGEQRGAAAADYDNDGRTDLVVSQNGADTRLFHNRGARPGLSVRVSGPAGNPDGVGAVLRLKTGADWGPAREIHAGSGYWSQDGAAQVLGAGPSGTPRELRIRWPGGRTMTMAVPAEARTVRVDGGR